jgi:hypothetical protein
MDDLTRSPAQLSGLVRLFRTIQIDTGANGMLAGCLAGFNDDIDTLRQIGKEIAVTRDNLDFQFGGSIELDHPSSPDHPQMAQRIAFQTGHLPAMQS